MFRIGILGTENSHADGFTKIFNGFREDCREEFADMQVVAVGGHVPQASRLLCEKYGVAQVADRPEDMLGKVDAVMVTARDGRYHAGFAKPFIEAGVPAFIDKPFTSDPQEALELVRLARSKRLPLAGGSSLKLCPDVIRLAQIAAERKEALCSGDVTAPVSLHNEYGGFWFYASHLAEICLRIFGPDPEWVWASLNGRGVTAVMHYPDFEVTHHFTDQAYQYAASLNLKDGIIQQPLCIDDFTLLECRSFARMLRTGEMDFTYEELIRPVYVLQAIETSMRTGQKVPIPSFRL